MILVFNGVLGGPRHADTKKSVKHLSGTNYYWRNEIQKYNLVALLLEKIWCTHTIYGSTWVHGRTRPYLGSKCNS